MDNMTIKENDIVITEDGYKFVVQADGSLTDGEMSFNSINELVQSVDIQVIKKG